MMHSQENIKFCFDCWFGCSVCINCAKLIKVHTLTNVIFAVIKHFNNRRGCQQDKSSVLERNTKHTVTWWLACWQMTVVSAVIRSIPFWRDNVFLRGVHLELDDCAPLYAQHDTRGPWYAGRDTRAVTHDITAATSFPAVYIFSIFKLTDCSINWL